MTKTFVEIWRDLSPQEKDEFASDLGKVCYKSSSTIRHWGFGTFHPSKRLKDPVIDFCKAKGIETTWEALFPNHKQLKP